MPQQLVFIENNQALTTSLKVAEYFDKRHNDVLRAIENAKSNLRNFAHVKKSFIKTSYVDAKGENRPMYLLDKKAFAFVVGKFTGEKAAEWSWKFINAFETMEKQLQKMSEDYLKWKQIRRAGIEQGRKPFTAAIQRYEQAERPEKVGSYYGKATNDVHKLCGIEKGGRDKADGLQLAKLMIIESAGANQLNAHEPGKDSFFPTWNGCFTQNLTPLSQTIDNNILPNTPTPPQLSI